MSKTTKKASHIFMMSLTVLMSGALGFGGGYLANQTQIKGAVESTSSNIKTQQNTESSSLAAPLISTSGNTSNKELTISEITSKASVSVVEITTETVTTGGRMRQYISEGAGSGVIVSEDGYIVTNNHVIDGATKISIKTKDGDTYEGTLIGKDSKTDLAIVKIEADHLPAATLGSSEELVVGELAVAIGNPLGELGGTVTEGIISALNRDVIIDGESMNLLQTSAAINPGNSGGGLFNNKGELVGIVNAKSSGSDIEGIGFAIPVDTAKEVMSQLINYGYVQGRVETGLTLIDIADMQTAMIYRVQKPGVYVLKVIDTESSFKSGDRIISIDGVEVSDSTAVKTILDKHEVGDTLSVVIQRGNSVGEISLTLREHVE